MKAAVGEGESGTSQPRGWAPRAPRSSHPVSVALGVPVPVGVPTTGLPWLCRPLQGSHLPEPGRTISIRPAEHLDPRGGGSAGSWARAQEPGWVLTLELTGQTLAALGSYKNGKSRFFTM